MEILFYVSFATNLPQNVTSGDTNKNKNSFYNPTFKMAAPPISAQRGCTFVQCINMSTVRSLIN